jgi:hypothetical protein
MMRMFAALAASAVFTLGAAPQESAKLVVHEWGTFTSVAGGDGASLDWRPLAGPSDLPSFVYDISREPRGFRHGGQIGQCSPDHKDCGKDCTQGTIRMETPVIYFYADRETTVSVKVDFPKGRITEWYPAARNALQGIDWGQVRILPNAQQDFPKEAGESHYYPARETDASPVRVCIAKKPEIEKFLFYRGVGTFDLPLKVTLAGDKVTVRNVGKDPIDQVVLFENRGGKIGYRIHCYLKDEVVLERPAADHGIDSLIADLTKILTGQGLYLKEAQAMVKTWRDSWFEPGLRVFYTVPGMATAHLLPLTMSPAPTELKRVLVGRAEIITPEMEAAITGIAAKLGSDALETREAATKALGAYGRFAEPVLKKILATTKDPEVKIRIQRILEG